MPAGPQKRLHNIRQVMGGLMDEAPTVMEKREVEELPKRLQPAAEPMPRTSGGAYGSREEVLLAGFTDGS
jgi:hypothetical protein